MGMAPKKIEEYFNKRKQYLTEEEYEVIVKALRKIDEAEPLSSKGHGEEFKERGNAEYKNGNFEAALDFYTRAVLQDPNNVIYLSNRAAAYSKLGMVEKAIKDCEDGLKIDDKFVKLYIRLGMLYLDRDEDKAYEIFGKGLAVDPENETLKKQRELLINKETSVQPVEDNKSQAIDGIFEKMNLGNFKNGNGLDFNSLFADKNIEDLINNVMKDKSPKELAEMVKSMMGTMDGLGKKK